jgi:hypothetical protein
MLGIVRRIDIWLPFAVPVFEGSRHFWGLMTATPNSEVLVVPSWQAGHARPHAVVGVQDVFYLGRATGFDALTTLIGSLSL